MNDNEPRGVAASIMSAPPAPMAPRERPIRSIVAQAGMALAVLAIAWTAQALR